MPYGHGRVDAAAAVLKAKNYTGNIASDYSATVMGTWSGVVSGSSSGTTGADGSVTLSSAKTRKTGTFTFTVTGVSKSGYSYVPGVTSGSISTAGAAAAEE